MNFRQAISSGFANYVNFFGRATAPEFWFWILFCLLGAVVTHLTEVTSLVVFAHEKRAAAVV